MRAIIGAGLVVIAACGASGDESPPGAGVVERVVDGDTVDVRIRGRDETVRLLGIDTPEVYLDSGPPECFGPEASEFVTRLLPPGTAVRLERDVVGRDHFGRLLAYVYTGDGMVNEEIVRSGYARVLTIEPNGLYHERFVAAARAADDAGLGLWAACAG